MRKFLVSLLAGLLSAGPALAGVVPNHGAPNMSGASIKAPSHEQDEQTDEAKRDQSADKQDGPKDEKR